MDNTIHKTAEPNVQLHFWDRDNSDLSQFFIRIYFIAVPKFDLSEPNISVLPSGMQRLFSPPALVRLQPWHKNLLSLQSKVRIAATVVPVQEGEDRNPPQPCTDS